MKYLEMFVLVSAFVLCAAAMGLIFMKCNSCESPPESVSLKREYILSDESLRRLDPMASVNLGDITLRTPGSPVDLAPAPTWEGKTLFPVAEGPRIRFTDETGEEIGALTFFKGHWHFTGDLDASARAFLDTVRRLEELEHR